MVGAGARVGADAYVTGSVLFDAASVGAGARVSGSVIGRGTVVGEGVVLDGVVLGDEVHIAPGNELRSGHAGLARPDAGPDLRPLLHRRLSPWPASRNCSRRRRPQRPGRCGGQPAGRSGRVAGAGPRP